MRTTLTRRRMISLRKLNYLCGVVELTFTPVLSFSADNTASDTPVPRASVPLENALELGKILQVFGVPRLRFCVL